MNLPENKNPNSLPIMMLGCVAVFLLPFVLRLGYWAAILLTLPFLVAFLVLTFRVIKRNKETNRAWMKENGVSEISSRQAKQILKSCPANEVKLVVRYENWPLHFANLAPRVLLVRRGGQRYWVQYWYMPQVFSLLMFAQRRKVFVHDVSDMQLRPSRFKNAG